VNRDEGMPAWLPWAAAGAACAAFLLVLMDVSVWHPGYTYGDERVEICKLQYLREGAPWFWQFSFGCLTRAGQWLWVRINGTALASLHTPEMAVLALEWLFLALVVRRWFGDETAAWSVLALTLSAQGWVWGRSLLAFQALPMEALLLAFLAGRVKGRLAAFSWGLAASLAFLDYDGAFIAVPGVWLACAAMDAPFRRRALYSALGLFAGGAALLWHGQAHLAAYAAARLGTGQARDYDPGLVGRLRFLWELVAGGPALPYFGVSGWPAWPPWAWMGLLLGAWSLRRTAGLAVVAWGAGAVLVMLSVHSDYGLPLHRLAAAVPALAVVTGVGLATMRRRLGRRAWLLGVLLAAGAASEGWAWWRYQQTYAPELYDRSQSLELLRMAYLQDLADPSVRVVTQLGGISQADARFVLDRSPVSGGPPPGRVLAVVPADYAPELRGMRAKTEWFWVAKGLEPAVVVSAQGAEASRLASIEDSLMPVVGTEMDPSPVKRARIDAWLRAAAPRDPWTRTAAVEADLDAAIHVGAVSPEEFSFLRAAKPLSAAPWMVLARDNSGPDPREAIADCMRAEALDPRDGEALLLEASCLRSLGDPRAAQVSAAWVALRASGAAWRHTE
jgi:hypothetical protein